MDDNGDVDGDGRMIALIPC